MALAQTSGEGEPRHIGRDQEHEHEPTDAALVAESEAGSSGPRQRR
jgi:hypothetical protein